MPYPYANCTIEQRREVVNKIKVKYPTLIPILIDIPGKDVKRRKYLTHESTTLSQLLYSVRQENKLNEYEGVFLFVNNHLLSVSQNVLDTYIRHANCDGFLYITIVPENIFGARIY